MVTDFVYKNTRKLHVFFTTENVANVKLETMSFLGERENNFTIRFLLLRSCYDHEHHVL